ncbi:MAG: AMP-binding protein [Oceanospirillaceae bacterium]|nr:AMP-binding protein [Oceanospirillaceae bacterium]
MRESTLRGSWLPAELNPAGYSNLNELFDECTSRYQDRTAFTSLGCDLSYADLDRYSRAFANYLLMDAGVKPGDRIALQLPNLIQYPILVFGALRAGVIVVNTNPLYTPEEMLHQFRDSGAKLLVIYASMAHKLEPILAETEIERVLVTQVGDFGGLFRGAFLNFAVRYIKRMEPKFSLPNCYWLKPSLEPWLETQCDYPQLSLGDIAVLQYTGGTTGVAKGAVLTHANLLANILQGRQVMQVAPQGWANLVISPLPLYHIYAFVVSQIIAAEGGHSLLIPNPRDLDGFIATLKRVRMSCFIGLNTLFIGLCRHSKFSQVDMSQLKATISGGMALTDKAADLWRQATGQEIIEAYGLTEASPAVTVNDPLKPVVGSIGRPLAATEIDIRESGYRSVGVNEPGELCVKGPQVMREYWLRPEETAATFTEDGYLRTGDIALIDDEGLVHIVDRAKDLIIVSGFNVYPTEVENVVASHPDILECAVVGDADPDTGELVHLYAVSSNPQLSAQDLKAWCAERLAGYKRPRKISFRETLPKTPVGKVLRRALRES